MKSRKISCIAAFVTILILFSMTGVLYAASLEISDENAAPGDQVVFRVRVNNAPNDVNAFGFDINYNSSFLQYQSYEKTDYLSEIFDQVDVNELSSGQIRIGGYGSGVNKILTGDTGVFLTLTFSVIQYGNAQLSITALKDQMTGWTTQNGQYVSADASEPNDSYIYSSIIDRPQYNNFHDAGDEDWGWIYGEAGYDYTIQIINPGSNSDPVLELFDVNGSTSLAVKNDGGLGAGETLTWTCPSDGIYYVKVSHSNILTFGADTEYTLQIEYPLGDAYEIDDSPDDSRVININAKPQRHTFWNKNDPDWVKFYGIAGNTYQIKALNLESICNVEIKLYDIDGVTVLSSQNNGGFGDDELITWTCLNEGIYYVEATYYDDTQSRIARTSESFGGSYDMMIQVQSVPPSDPPGAIIGRVTHTNSNKIPVRDAIIRIGIGTQKRSSKSLSNGFFQISDIDKGTYTVSATKKGYFTAYKTKTVNSNQITLVYFTMACNGDVNGGGISPSDAMDAFYKYFEICPTYTGMDCIDVCCDVNRDGSCTPDDALCIFNNYMGVSEDGCPDLP